MRWAASDGESLIVVYVHLDVMIYRYIANSQWPTAFAEPTGSFQFGTERVHKQRENVIRHATSAGQYGQ